MVSLVFTVLMIAYMLSSLHSNLMYKLGLSERDEKLMVIGLLLAGVFRSVITLVEILLIGSISFGLLLNILLLGFLIRMNYQRL
jgi:hypothetical protein